MAAYGAKNPYFNKIKSAPDNALPVYEDAAPVKIGKLVKADLSLQFASGKLYGDDELAESVDEFVSGTLAMETDDMTDDVASEIYGASVEDGLVTYNAGDNPPEGGVAYYKVLMRNGKKLFKGYFYPRAKAVLGNDSAQTKGDSITFGTSATSFTIFAASNGDWRKTEEFETEAEAQAWVVAMLTAADPSQTPGS